MMAKNIRGAAPKQFIQNMPYMTQQSSMCSSSENER